MPRILSLRYRKRILRVQEICVNVLPYNSISKPVEKVYVRSFENEFALDSKENCKIVWIF